MVHKASLRIDWREWSHYHTYLRNTPLLRSSEKKETIMQASPHRARASLASQGTLSACFGGRGSLHSRRPSSNSNARHVWSWFSLSAAVARDPDPSGQDARTRGGVPAPRSQQRPPPQPHSRLPPHLGSELLQLRVTHPLPDSSPGSPPAPGVSVSHPEDECVDQQDTLETSDDRFGLQPPRRGRHD